MRFIVAAKDGWLVGFNVELELRSGLLPTVWNSSVRMVWIHDITIFILHGGYGSPVDVESDSAALQ